MHELFAAKRAWYFIIPLHIAMIVTFNKELVNLSPFSSKSVLDAQKIISKCQLASPSEQALVRNFVQVHNQCGDPLKNLMPWQLHDSCAAVIGVLNGQQM